jgi:hypothetical protein
MPNVSITLLLNCGKMFHSLHQLTVLVLLQLRMTPNSLVTVSFYSQGIGSPGGSNNQVQINDGTGSFLGSANLTFNRITNQLAVSGNASANVITANSFRGAVTGSIGATTPNTGAFTSITATTTAAITGNVNAGNTNISGVANVVGNLNAGNIRTAGLANVGNLQVVANVTSNLLPSTDQTFDLGSLSQEWKNVYVGTSILLILNLLHQTELLQLLWVI